MQQPVSIGISDDPFAVGERGFYARVQKSIVNRLDSPAQQPKRDLRRRAVMRGSERLAARVHHAHCSAGLGRAAVDDVTREDPGMPGVYALRSFSIDAYGGHLRHGLI